MHALTMSKGSILLILLCCHLHISTATGTIGQKVGEKIVTSSILGGIAKTAQTALIKTVSPFYKFFVEGGFGIVTRYFTMSDYWGIGHNVRKGAVYTASKAGKALTVVSTVVSKSVKKYAQKRLEEQMEEMNRWWTRKKLNAVSSVASGIGGGIGAAFASNALNKITGIFSGSAVATSGGSSGNTDPTTAATTSATTAATTTEKNHYGISISNPVKLTHLALGAHPDSDSTSQVIIGKPIGPQTGEAETSSTVAIWKDPFGWLFGNQVIEEDSSESVDIFGSLFGGSEDVSIHGGHGCPTCGKEGEGNPNARKLNVLKGKRTIRSIAGTDTDSLVRVFQNVERDDPQHCLPMVLCAIHADHEGRRSPQEANLVTVFRPLVIQRHVPEWAGPWVQGARHGTAAAGAQGKAKETDTTCEKAFPKCPFSAQHLRTLMASTLWGDEHKLELKNNKNLEPNIL